MMSVSFTLNVIHAKNIKYCVTNIATTFPILLLKNLLLHICGNILQIILLDETNLLLLSIKIL